MNKPFDVVYFTTTTQTAVGYGDITPKSKKAKFVVIINQILLLFMFSHYILVVTK
jgi:hypothetical protein